MYHPSNEGPYEIVHKSMNLQLQSWVPKTIGKALGTHTQTQQTRLAWWWDIWFCQVTTYIVGIEGSGVDRRCWQPSKYHHAPWTFTRAIYVRKQSILSPLFSPAFRFQLTKALFSPKTPLQLQHFLFTYFTHAHSNKMKRERVCRLAVVGSIAVWDLGILAKIGTNRSTRSMRCEPNSASTLSKCSFHADSTFKLFLVQNHWLGCYLPYRNFCSGWEPSSIKAQVRLWAS